MKIIIFDYVYYRSYYIYKNYLQASDPMIYALCVVSLIQQFNFFTILYFTYTFFDLDIDVNKYILYVSFLVFIIPNYIRYSKFRSYKKMDETWRNESKKKKISGIIFIIIYMILSIIGAITAAIILG